MEEALDLSFDRLLMMMMIDIGQICPYNDIIYNEGKFTRICMGIVCMFVYIYIYVCVCVCVCARAYLPL